MQEKKAAPMGLPHRHGHKNMITLWASFLLVIGNITHPHIQEAWNRITKLDHIPRLTLNAGNTVIIL
jgi:hypothetical protein